MLLIPCPYCGERDSQEFVYRGDASPRRPEGEDGFYDYVYLRDNVIGEMAEQEDHHPLIVLEWGKVTVEWWTHKIGGLHRNDFISAAKTDSLVPEE